MSCSFLFYVIHLITYFILKFVLLVYFQFARDKFKYGSDLIGSVTEVSKAVASGHGREVYTALLPFRGHISWRMLVFQWWQP